MQQSNDPYQYCLGDPSYFIDPDGQWAFVAPLVSIAWGAGATVTAPIWAPCAAAEAAGATIGYWGYKGYKHYKNTHKDSSFDLNVMERNKKGGVDPSLPKNPAKDKNWEDISHPEAKNNGHHKYRNKKTGEEIEFNKGKPGNHGHKAHDHYHRPNPNKTGKYNKYLDQYGNPVSDGTDPSHLYPPEWIWW